MISRLPCSPSPSPSPITPATQATDYETAPSHNSSHISLKIIIRKKQRTVSALPFCTLGSYALHVRSATTRITFVEQS